MKKAAENPWVTILGIQYYSGTQKKHPAQIPPPQRELERLDGLARRLTEVYGIELKELEYGPDFRFVISVRKAHGGNSGEPGRGTKRTFL